MLTLSALGYLHVLYPCGMYKPISREKKPPGFFSNMMLVGVIR